jgi:hypothetical protein
VSLYRNGVLVAQGRSDASGVYRISRTLAAGTFTFQVRTPDDQHNLGTASPLRRALVVLASWSGRSPGDEVDDPRATETAWSAKRS